MGLNNKIKVMFIVPNMSAGGSERIISFLSQNIDKSIFSPILIVIGKKSDSVYKIKNVEVKFLEKDRVLNGILPLYSCIIKEKPDIVLSVIGHLNTVLAYMSIVFRNIKFIAREATVLSYGSGEFKAKRKNLRSIMGNNRFNFFDKIICQSNDMLEDIKENHKVKANKLVVINNPITNNELDSLKKGKSEDVLKFITVARLSREKGVSRIIRILSKCDFPFHYTLIGDGDEKDSVFSLIEKKGLEKKITHIPFTDQVDDFLVKHDFFLQGSYVEGFPNALLESCVVGTPVIAFNVPGGTKEIVENGVNGFLVDNEKEFLERLNEQRVFKPKVVRASVTKKFNQEKILGEYEKLFSDLVKNE